MSMECAAGELDDLAREFKEGKPPQYLAAYYGLPRMLIERIRVLSDAHLAYELAWLEERHSQRRLVGALHPYDAAKLALMRVETQRRKGDAQ